jgi:hypothetical protein
VKFIGHESGQIIPTAAGPGNAFQSALRFPATLSWLQLSPKQAICTRRNKLECQSLLNSVSVTAQAQISRNTEPASNATKESNAQGKKHNRWSTLTLHGSHRAITTTLTEARITTSSKQRSKNVF